MYAITAEGRSSIYTESPYIWNFKFLFFQETVEPYGELRRGRRRGVVQVGSNFGKSEDDLKYYVLQNLTSCYIIKCFTADLR